MEDEFIRVTDNSEDDFMELPVEKDGALLLSTLAAQYPGITGLRYKNDKSGAWRGIRLEDGKLYPPDTNAWGDRIYWAVFPKSDKKIEKTSSLTEKADEAKKCCDLIVLGLPWATDENSLRDYFATFGSLVFVQVKRDAFGKSKGFGFIRFSDSNAQTLCMAQKHNIDGRMCEVRIPYSKVISLPHGNGKIHVGRVTDDITSDDILAFFSQYGRVLEVFIPKPCRGFAFVTFADPDVAQKLIGEDLILKNTSIRISYANAQPWEHNNHTSNDNINNPNSNRNNFQPYPTASAHLGPKANSTPLNNLLPHNPFFIASRYPPPQHSSSKGIPFPFGYYGSGHPSFPFHHHQNNFPPYYHVNQNHGNTLLGSGKALIHTTNVPINNNTYSQYVISQSPLPSSSKMAGAFKTFTDTWKASTHIGSSTNISSTNYSWTTNSENPYNFNSFLDNLPSSFPTISTVVSSYGLTPHSYNMVNHINHGQNDSNNHHHHPLNTNVMGPAHLSFFPTNPSALPGIGLAGVNNTHHPQNFSLINAPLHLQDIPGLSSQPYALLQNQHYPQILKHANSHHLINHNNFSVFNPYYGSSYHYTQMNHSMPNPTFFLPNNNNCVVDTANVKSNHVFENKLHTYQANGQQQVPIHFQNYSQYMLSYYSAIAAAYAIQHHNTNYKSFHNFAPSRQMHSNNVISESKLETHENYEESTKDRNTSSVILSNLEYLDDTDHSVTPIKTINDTGLAGSGGGSNLGDSNHSHVNYSPFHDHHTILNKPNIEASLPPHQLPFHFGIGHGGNVNGHHEMPYLQAYFQQALLLQNQMNQHRSLNIGENKLVHNFPLYPNQMLSNQQQSISHQHHGGDNLNSPASLDNKSRAHHDNNFNQKSLASVITGTRSRNSSLCQNINDLRLRSLIEGDGESFFEGCGEHIYATNNNDSGFINGEATLNLDNNGLSHANLPDMTKNDRSSIDKNNLTLISSLTQHSKSSIYSISTANNNYGCSFNLDINSSNKNVSLLSGALCPIPSSAWDNVAEISEKPNDNNLQMSNFRSKNVDFSIALNQRNIHTKSLPRSRCNSSFSACSSTNIGFPLVSNYNNNTNKLRHCTDGSITDLELEMLLFASNEHLNLIKNNKNVGTDFNNNHIENGGISKGFNHQPFSHMIEEKRENGSKLTEMLLESIHESRQKQNGSFTSNSDLDYFGGSIGNLKHESLGSNFDVHDSDCHGNNSIRSFGTAASQQYLAGSPPTTVFVQNIIDTLLTTNEQSNVDKKSAEHYEPNEMVLIDEDAILLKDAISSSTTNIPNY